MPCPCLCHAWCECTGDFPFACRSHSGDAKAGKVRLVFGLNTVQFLIVMKNKCRIGLFTALLIRLGQCDVCVHDEKCRIQIALYEITVIERKVSCSECFAGVLLRQMIVLTGAERPLVHAAKPAPCCLLQLGVQNGEKHGRCLVGQGLPKTFFRLNRPCLFFSVFLARRCMAR